MAVASVVAAIILVVAWPAASVLGATQLSGGSVTPPSGTTNTVFTFRVTASGNPPPAKVVVDLVGTTLPAIPLARQAANTWVGSSRVSAVGVWQVRFQALNGQGKVIAAAGSTPATVTVTAPTPAPTPRPTASPTPRPTAAGTVAPTGRPTPHGSLQATGSPTAPSSSSASPAPATPVGVGGATEASPSISPATTGGQGGGSGSLVLAVLLGMFVILGVAGIALLGGRRRSPAAAPVGRNPPAPLGGVPTLTRLTTAPPPPAPRPPPAWERYTKLEDEPIGTVDDLTIPPSRDVSGSPGDEAASTSEPTPPAENPA